jgi:cytochrome c-type biogenesis protein CcmF
VIAEIGLYALVLAAVTSLLQGTVPLIGAARRRLAWMGFADRAALAQLLLVAIAFGCLVAVFVLSDFSVRLVAANSHTAKPLLYKISGAWGNHEGSLLLWVLILAVFGAAVASFGGGLPATLKARVLAVQGLIGLGFHSFMLATSNPFARLDPAPLDGNDLNPLLQDPGLAFHPPMLYLGYVGLSVAYAFAVAALIEGRVDAAWARWVRPWTLAAWTALTAGIALGSWWAYYELGWGGWWFWDPVENASFMPWLMATALLHSASVVEKRDALKSWTILLAIIAFGLSLMGTFLVRSGVLTSVHAFASDPGRGLFVLMLLAIAVGGALALYAVRAPAMAGGGLFQPISREGALLLNNILLSAAAATVFLGTLYPLFLDVAGGGAVSVGPPYFRATFVPMMIPLALAAAVGPLLAWRRGDLLAALQRLWLAGIAAALATLATLWLKGVEVGPVIGIALAAWLGIGTLIAWAERTRLFRAGFAESVRRARHLPRAAYGMTLAHLGLAVLIAGVTASTAWKEERVLRMRPGDSVEIAGTTLTLEAVEPVVGPNYTAMQARFVTDRGAVLKPQRRSYWVQGTVTTEAAIRTSGLADLHAVVGEGGGAEGWVVRLYHQPLVPWIWAGALMMVLGGLLSLSDRRLRVAAPRRAAAPAGAARA